MLVFYASAPVQDHLLTSLLKIKSFCKLEHSWDRRHHPPYPKIKDFPEGLVRESDSQNPGGARRFPGPGAGGRRGAPKCGVWNKVKKIHFLDPTILSSFLFFWGGGPHLAVLKAYSFLCTQESLLKVLRSSIGMLRIRPRCQHSRQASFLLHYQPVPANTRSLFTEN